MTDPNNPSLIDVVRSAHAASFDDSRLSATARQHARGARTARERLEATCDPGSFVEYGQLVQAAVPGDADPNGTADGLVSGTGTIDGAPVCTLIYDYTVFGGSQSARNHRKAERMFWLAREHLWPVVIWSEGGGARPQDMFHMGGAVSTFTALARLSGLIPTVCVLPGRAFAGHANLAGLCDLVIATDDACIGMAGPPLVLAASGISFTPEELGPVSMHAEVGVVDIVVSDEAEATETVARYLQYFGGRLEPGDDPDTSKLESAVPADPRLAYDVRDVISLIADVGTFMELRTRFGTSVVVGLAFIGGHPVGIVASQPSQLAGSINADASDKIARHVQLCDAFDIPLVYLCDTPGFLVGPDVERTALIRHSARALAAAANATVPKLTVILRKAYGLGYYAMGSESLDPTLLIAWPTAEFGGMGLEGAVNIMHGTELAAMSIDERVAFRAARTAELKEGNTALARGRLFQVDDVIDPCDTRDILRRTLDLLPVPPPRSGRKHPVDPW